MRGKEVCVCGGGERQGFWPQLKRELPLSEMRKTVLQDD